LGLANDKLVPTDYDGNGKTDPTVYRDGTWYIVRSSNGSFNKSADSGQEGFLNF